MGIKQFIKTKLRPHTYSSDALISYLKQCGVKVGDYCHIYSPETVNIDIARPYLLEIGNNVVITAGVEILTHDYSHTVIRKKFGENIGDAQDVKIGDNVFIGRHSTILMGTHIGNNVIIGTRAVVRGNIPDNVVVAGNPAAVVCTIDQYYQRRKEKCLERAFLNVKLCRERLNRNPTIREMGNAFAWLYLPRTEETLNTYPDFFNLYGENSKALIDDFLNSEPMFDSYDAFLDAVK